MPDLSEHFLSLDAFDDHSVGKKASFTRDEVRFCELGWVLNFWSGPACLSWDCCQCQLAVPWLCPACYCLACQCDFNAPSHLKPPPPTPGMAGESGDNHLIFTSLCFPLGRVNTHFHFFVAWFSDGSRSSGGQGGSERMTSSHLKIMLTAGDSHLICQWSHFRATW